MSFPSTSRFRITIVPPWWAHSRQFTFFVHVNSPQTHWAAFSFILSTFSPLSLKSFKSICSFVLPFRQGCFTSATQFILANLTNAFTLTSSLESLVCTPTVRSRWNYRVCIMLSLHGTTLLRFEKYHLVPYPCLFVWMKSTDSALMFKVRPDFDLKSSSETIKPVKQVYLPSLMCCLLQTVISCDICAEQHLTGPTDLIAEWSGDAFTSMFLQKKQQHKKQMCCVRDVQKLAQPVNLELRRSEMKRMWCSGICVAMQPRELEWPGHERSCKSPRMIRFPPQNVWNLHLQTVDIGSDCIVHH